jgi:hypothetical protein
MLRLAIKSIISASVLLAIICAGSSASFAEEVSWTDNLTLSGTLETEWAGTTDDVSNQKFETILQPELNTSLTDHSSLTGIFRIRVDAKDKLEPGIPVQGNRSTASSSWHLADDLDAEIRELYIDSYFDDASLRVGKQQVVWGQADGLKVLDVVNPQSYREFILDDFDNSRIPLWSLNAELPVGVESLVQLIWIPDTTYNDIPETGSAFAYSSPRIVPQAVSGYSTVTQDSNKPDNPVSDSDFGVRVSTLVEGWDMTLNYLYHYNDNPILYRQISGTQLTITPKYERTHLVGGTLSNAFGDYIFRSEVGYSTNSYHVSHDTTDADGIKETGEVSYVLGLDYSGVTDTFLSAQFFQSVLTEDHPDVSRDQVENTITLLAEKNFVNETWKAEILLIRSLNDGDGMVRPKIFHEFSSNINIWLGADVFHGDSDGFYGQFGYQDRVTVGFEWGF